MLRLVEAQEDLFQRRLVCRNIRRVVLARDVNDLRQVTLDDRVARCAHPRPEPRWLRPRRS